jgi:hypothetical protein
MKRQELSTASLMAFDRGTPAVLISGCLMRPYHPEQCGIRNFYLDRSITAPLPLQEHQIGFATAHHTFCRLVQITQVDMSRRAPNPAAERAAQNTQTIKGLLKLEGNKTCADCKRNKREPSSPSTLLYYSNKLQTRDGQAGIWASSSASGALAFTVAWEPISVG